MLVFFLECRAAIAILFANHKDDTTPTFIFRTRVATRYSQRDVSLACNQYRMCIFVYVLQTLHGEFKEKDEFLQSIETQIKDFKVLGKHQAAERLEKKMQMIKVSLISIYFI